MAQMLFRTSLPHQEPSSKAGWIHEEDPRKNLSHLASS